MLNQSLETKVCCEHISAMYNLFDLLPNTPPCDWVPDMQLQVLGGGTFCFKPAYWFVDELVNYVCFLIVLALSLWLWKGFQFLQLAIFPVAHA